MENKTLVIGVGGFARSGKDTFVKIAKKILKENRYTSERVAFADALKAEIDPFLKEFYGISAWTDKTEEKNIIRPLLVAHGCQKRVQSGGTYWINKIDESLRVFPYDVAFVSDCRFPNEVDWVHKLGGWFVHLKKYSVTDEWPNGQQRDNRHLIFNFDKAPNDEEAKNDPICEKNSDIRIELENVIEREQRLNGIKINVESLIDNTYLNEEIKLCLMKCPFLTIK